MGKVGRAACITIPWALTVASFICLVMVEVSGWNKGVLPSYYFMKVNFTDMDISSTSTLDNTNTLALALQEVENNLADVYEIHLWNYCSSDKRDGDITYCSKRQADYAFNPIAVFGLNKTTPTSTSSSSGALQSLESKVTGSINSEEETLLGKGAKDALDVYRKASKAMFVLYAVSFWTTLATIILGITAIFSRWGSFLTWIFAVVSSILTLAAVALSTALFVALVEAFRGVFDPYNIHTQLGTHVLAVTWLSVLFSWAGTLFWLFSVCCCSGNPHHKSNKGGLWNAERKGMGYGEYNHGGQQREKGYDRASSPFLGHSDDADRVPLNAYPGQTAYGQTGSYEPFRHT